MQQLYGRLTRVLEVVDREQDRMPAGQAAQQGADSVEGTPALTVDAAVIWRR